MRNSRSASSFGLNAIVVVGTTATDEAIVVDVVGPAAVLDGDRGVVVLARIFPARPDGVPPDSNYPLRDRGIRHLVVQRHDVPPMPRSAQR